jgi:hypothetical protein
MSSRIAVAVFSTLIVLSPSSGFTQEDAARNAREAGSWALQFSITDNFTLDDFSGTTLSVERCFSPGSAVRLGVGASVLDRNEEEDTALADTSVVSDTDTSAWDLSLELQYTHYMAPTERLSPFWALGPTFEYGGTDASRATLDETQESDRSNWAIGALASFGVAWFPSDPICLHAEYGVGMAYSSETTTVRRQNGSTATAERRTTGWSLDGERVRFGLSVYF